MADHPGLADAAGAGPVGRGRRGAHVRDFAGRAALLRAAGHPRHRVARGRHRPRAGSIAGWRDGPAAAAVRLHSGELVARVGADVDELADVLVRALVPIGVAAVLAVAATAVVAVDFAARRARYWRSVC